MPTILPPSRNQLGEVIAELEALGGKAKTDFRMARLRGGAAALEVSDDLYDKWHSRAKSKRVGLPADEAEGAQRELRPDEASPPVAEADDDNPKSAPRKSSRR